MYKQHTFAKQFFLAVLLMTSFISTSFAQDLQIAVRTGPHWKEKRAAQCAIWLETVDGQYIKTLYVTNRASRKNWVFGPKEGRPESLPVWYHAQQGSFENSPEVDVVTSATPKTDIDFIFHTDNPAVVIKVECNNSFDYNDYYTKKTSGVNGQPSVVYQGSISSISDSETCITLEFAGVGSLDGSDGSINPDTSHLTTATQIIEAIVVTIPNIQ